MALYKVDSDTADLTKVAGGTLYADLPIGSWIKNDMATIPSGFLKVGDTILESECPELYAKYGSTVPYKADTSELSEYETFTITTSNKEVNYDGILIINFNPSSSTQLLNGTVFVNNVVIGNVSSSNGQQQAIMVEVKKGDNIKYAGSNTGTVTGKIAYYKKSLIIKAKHTPVPADFMDAVDEAVEEVVGEDTGWQSIGSYGSKYRVKNGFCTLFVSEMHTINLDANGGANLSGTLPSSIRPSFDLSVPVYVYGYTGDVTWGRTQNVAKIRTDGLIRLSSGIVNDFITEVEFVVTYPIN